MLKRWIGALLVTLLIIGRLPLWAIDGAVYLGVLEQWHPYFVDEKNPTSYQARAAFMHQGKEWSAMPNDAKDQQALAVLSNRFPESITWTIAFDGHNYGQFKSDRPSPWLHYADVGIYQPEPKTPVRLVKEGATDFHYWDGSPAFRPLVLVSAPYVKDPNSWKLWHPTRTEFAALFPAFRKAVGAVILNSKEPATLKYPDTLIILARAYRSNNGNSLVSLQIDPQHITSDGDMPEENWSDHWFLIRSGEPKFIGKSMTLIDAGDYDNDGFSEVLFHQSGYNYDGYLLLYDQLQQQAKFGWGYH